MSDNPVKLVTTKPDTEVAAELKAEVVEATKPLLEACTKAHKEGFIVSIQFGPNYLGNYAIQSLSLSKLF